MQGIHSQVIRFNLIVLGNALLFNVVFLKLKQEELILKSSHRRQGRKDIFEIMSSCCFARKFSTA